jgi:cytochrome c
MEEHMFERSQKEAKEWVAKAITFYTNSGKEIALAEFTNQKGPFIQDEMYIFVLNTEGNMVAHGVNEKYMGQNFIGLKDSEGKKFIREIIDDANTKGSGWTDYEWYNPVTKKTMPKIVYFEKVDDLIFCSGAYIEDWLPLISYNLQFLSQRKGMNS